MVTTSGSTVGKPKKNTKKLKGERRHSSDAEKGTEAGAEEEEEEEEEEDK